MRAICIAVLFTIASNAVMAQSLGSATSEIKGMPGGQTAYNKEGLLIHLNDKEFVYAAARSEGINATLIKVNDKPEESWESSEIKGFLFASKFNGNIIVFSSPEMKKQAALLFGGEHIKTIHASIFDSKTGKIIFEKDALHVDDIDRTDLQLIKDSADNFKYLLVQASHYEGGGFHIGLAKIPQKIIEFFELVSFSNDAEIKNNFKIDLAKFQTGTYISALCDEQSNVYVAFLFNGTLVVNKYSDQGVLITSLKTKAFYEDENVSIVGGRIFKLSGNDVYFVANIDEPKQDAIFIMCHFDFTAKRTYFQQTIVDQDFFKQNGSKSLEVSILSAKNIFFYKDDIVIIKEILRMGNSTSSSQQPGNPYYFYGPMFVSLYDKTMKLKKEIGILEGFKAYLSFGGYSTENILNDKLMILFCGLQKSKIETISSVVDLENFTPSEPKTVNTTDGNVAMFGAATFWNNNVVIIPYLDQHSALAPAKQNTIWQRIDF